MPLCSVPQPAGFVQYLCFAVCVFFFLSAAPHLPSAMTLCCSRGFVRMRGMLGLLSVQKSNGGGVLCLGRGDPPKAKQTKTYVY